MQSVIDKVTEEGDIVRTQLQNVLKQNTAAPKNEKAAETSDDWSTLSSAALKKKTVKELKEYLGAKVSAIK